MSTLLSVAGEQLFATTVQQQNFLWTTAGTPDDYTDISVEFGTSAPSVGALDVPVRFVGSSWALTAVNLDGTINAPSGGLPARVFYDGWVRNFDGSAEDGIVGPFNGTWQVHLRVLAEDLNADWTAWTPSEMAGVCFSGYALYIAGSPVPES
jgi:hypothetical protein